jgi:hypothetical protein
VVLLQARQSLGATGLAQFATAVAAAGKDLRVLRTGEVPLVRETATPPEVAGAELVADSAEWPALIPVSASAIVTNDEYLLGVATDLCDKFGLPTTIPGSWNNYRHKGIMRRTLESAGVPVPESLIVTDGVPESAGGCTGFDPEDSVVVKPSAEANLRGIRVEKFAAVDPVLVGDGLVERFLAGPQYHSEVLVRGGAVTPLFSCRYVRSLLDLTIGLPSGSARVDAVLEARLADLAVRTCTALGSDGEFTAHVEYLSVDDDPEQIVVSEVCARASGGEVPYQSRIIVGFDLEAANLGMQACLDRVEPIVDPQASAGWLWQVGRPIIGSDRIAHLAVDATFDQITLGGRARLCSDSAAEVMAALEILAAVEEER